jgi:hypothetical protein
MQAPHPAAVSGGAEYFCLIRQSHGAFRGSSARSRFKACACELPPSISADRSLKSFTSAIAKLLVPASPIASLPPARLILWATKWLKSLARKPSIPRKYQAGSPHEQRLWAALLGMRGGDFIRSLFDGPSLWSLHGRFRNSQVVSLLKIPNGLF